MSQKAHYTNKHYVRKAITMLFDRTILFSTDERSKDDGGYYEFEIGLTFLTNRRESITIWPTCESDLNELQSLIE